MQSSVQPSFRTRLYRMRQAVRIQPDRAACVQERKESLNLACGDRCIRSETSGGQPAHVFARYSNRRCPTCAVSWYRCRFSGSPIGTACVRQKGQVAHVNGLGSTSLAAGARCCLNISTASLHTQQCTHTYTRCSGQMPIYEHPESEHKDGGPQSDLMDLTSSFAMVNFSARSKARPRMSECLCWSFV